MSVRQVITVLGGYGYRVDVCDPNPLCIGRFSRYVRRFHRCPPLGADPAAYLAFIIERLKRERIDVLLPVHEQAYLFAGLREHLPDSVGLALPPFESFELVQNKVSFSQLLTDLGLPQPRTRVIQSEAELLVRQEYPFYVKTAIGTASRGVWLVKDRAGLEDVAAKLAAQGAFSESVLIQEVLSGALERAQAVFDRRQLVAFHTCRQIIPGIGGGDAVKQSVRRDIVGEHLSLLGQRLEWHGPMSLDFIFDEGRQSPSYIDANPRLVEPVNAQSSGVELVRPWLSLAQGNRPPASRRGKAGVKTHMAVQALLGSAAREDNRLKLLRECWRLLRKKAPYASSTEELTPLRTDPLSCVVPAALVAQLLLGPRRMAERLSSTSARAHQLNLKVVRYVRERRKQDRTAKTG